MQTNSFTIDKNVPLPERKPGREAKYPFGEMEVGVSFEFPLHKRNSIAPAARMWGRRFGTKFATRKIDAETARCWRVA